MISHLGSPPTQKQREVNVNQPPAVSLNRSFSVYPLARFMSWPSLAIGYCWVLVQAVRKIHLVKDHFLNFRTVHGVKKQSTCCWTKSFDLLTVQRGGIFLKCLDSDESNCLKWAAGLTLSHPGTLPVDRSDLAAFTLTPYVFEIGRPNSPVAWSCMTFDTLMRICLFKRRLCRVLSDTLPTLSAIATYTDLIQSCCKGNLKKKKCLTHSFFLISFSTICVFVVSSTQCSLPPTSPFFFTAFIVLADSPLLLYPVISCSPIHPVLPKGLFMLGLAAHTSLPGWEAQIQ